MHLSARKPDLIILNSETRALINGEREKASKCDSDFVGASGGFGDWGAMQNNHFFIFILLASKNI